MRGTTRQKNSARRARGRLSPCDKDWLAATPSSLPLSLDASQPVLPSTWRDRIAGRCWRFAGQRLEPTRSYGLVGMHLFSPAISLRGKSPLTCAVRSQTRRADQRGTQLPIVSMFCASPSARGITRALGVHVIAHDLKAVTWRALAPVQPKPNRPRFAFCCPPSARGKAPSRHDASRAGARFGQAAQGGGSFGKAGA